MSAPARPWRKLREDRAGMVGLVIVIVYLLVAMGVWLGVVGQDWSVAEGPV